MSKGAIESLPMPVLDDALAMVTVRHYNRVQAKIEKSKNWTAELESWEAFAPTRAILEEDLPLNGDERLSCAANAETKDAWFDKLPHECPFCGSELEVSPGSEGCPDTCSFLCDNCGFYCVATAPDEYCHAGRQGQAGEEPSD